MNELINVQVENQEGVANFDEILANSDAFMVARGDLGMEIPIEKMFLAQKLMIQKCNVQGKAVVTATQMLESMIKSPRPTRAEATDVANAVIDGTDCVMLSGETAAGAYPVVAVETMAKICMEAENCVNYSQVFRKIVKAAPLPMSPLESLACAAVQTANSAGAALVLVVARGGNTARLVSKYRPSMSVLSVVVAQNNDEFQAKQGLMICRGVVPMVLGTLVSQASRVEEIVELAIKQAKSRKLCKPGDSIVMVQHAGNTAISIFTVN